MGEEGLLGGADGGEEDGFEEEGGEVAGLVLVMVLWRLRCGCLKLEFFFFFFSKCLVFKQHTASIPSPFSFANFSLEINTKKEGDSYVLTSTS